MDQIVAAWKVKFGPAVKVSQLISSRQLPVLNTKYNSWSVPLSEVMDDFLSAISVKDPRDVEEHSAMLIALAILRGKNLNLMVDVFLMNNLSPNYRTRVSNSPIAPINQYFSASANSMNDLSFVSDSNITLQLRRFDLGTEARNETSADIRDVPWFALNVPTPLRKDLTVEERR